MKYILVNAKVQGLPYYKVIDYSTPEVKTYGLDVVVTIGIVGQIYTGFNNLDLLFCPIERSDTIDNIEEKVNKLSEAHIITKYPNN